MELKITGEHVIVAIIAFFLCANGMWGWLWLLLLFAV